MAGDHGHGGHDVSHAGLTLHPPRRWHTRLGQGMCAMMWFWILYRAKQDGPVVLGWRHPWDGHGQGHGHDEHVTEAAVCFAGPPLKSRWSSKVFADVEALEFEGIGYFAYFTIVVKMLPSMIVDAVNAFSYGC